MHWDAISRASSWSASRSNTAPGRLAVPVFHDADNYHFEIGKGEQITEGNDIAIIATGLM